MGKYHFKHLLKYISTISVCWVLCIFFNNCNTLSTDNKEDSNNSNESNHSKDKIKDTIMTVSKKLFGNTPDNQDIYIYKLKNNKGLVAELINYGAILVTMKVPDGNGRNEDIVLGYDNLEDYIADPVYFGATIGRYANRIGNARFSIDEKEYKLAANTYPDFGPNHLHGGVKGFNKVVWNGKEIINEKEVGVEFSYLSKDGEEGYPGNVRCRVVYLLTNENELKITFEAETDKPTIVNMTHHSYFNLKGEGSGDILGHELMINADKFTPADDDLIPAGMIESVIGLPVDFTKKRTIGSQIEQMRKLKFTGYDINYVLNKTDGDTLEFAARVYDPDSKRVMEVFTTKPCMHFYTSNFLDGRTGKNEKVYNKYGALCLEPQFFPDSPNHDNFPSVVLKKDEKYHHEIIYKFMLK